MKKKITIILTIIVVIGLLIALIFAMKKSSFKYKKPHISLYMGLKSG